MVGVARAESTARGVQKKHPRDCGYNSNCQLLGRAGARTSSVLFRNCALTRLGSQGKERCRAGEVGSPPARFDFLRFRGGETRS